MFGTPGVGGGGPTVLFGPPVLLRESRPDRPRPECHSRSVRGLPRGSRPQSQGDSGVRDGGDLDSWVVPLPPTPGQPRAL